MKRGDPKTSLLIAIVEDAEKTDGDRSVVRIFDVNEKVIDIKKELNQMKLIRKELKQLKQLFLDDQKQRKEAEQAIQKLPQVAEHQVSLDEIANSIALK